MDQAQKLRDLAAWYRKFAEHADNPTIWDARLRTAEELEKEAGALERRRETDFVREPRREDMSSTPGRVARRPRLRATRIRS